MTLYAESATDQTNHFADAFVRENAAHGYEVVMTLLFNAILFTEIQCKKMYILMFKQRFQCEFG